MCESDSAEGRGKGMKKKNRADRERETDRLAGMTGRKDRVYGGDGFSYFPVLTIGKMDWGPGGRRR